MVRLMERGDLERVVEIARASLTEAWTPDGFVAELAKATSLCLVFCEEARIVGVGIGSVVVDEVEIVVVAVDPAARRRGIGRALVDALVARAVERGARTAYLEVRASNAAAIALYTSHGFRPVGARARYYADGEDAVLMASALAT